MTRSSTKELLSPFENSKQIFRSRRRLFDTPSLVESNSPEFDHIFDIEEQSGEEVRETMTETMEQYMSKIEYRNKFDENDVVSQNKARRSDDKEYEFSYADLPRLSVKDVKDMYLLKVQDKPHHLPLEFLSEVKKFSDGTLVKIKENLIDMLSKNKLGSGNKRLKGRDWTDYDVKRSIEMLKKIDEVLRHRKQLRRLEEFVRGRPKTINPLTFVIIP
ncbi:hypothetical protein Tco_1057387 [Tanacetum coccineum]|uniref:Uncharacterized protein n=1 Tax=Tanacetum coccineum TaxID=301880 RepID=A0ABQ5H590_9ASTR